MIEIQKGILYLNTISYTSFLKFIYNFTEFEILIGFLNYFAKNPKAVRTQFVYFGPQIKFCGWAFKMNFCIWNFMVISKNHKKRSSIIEVQITK